MESEPGIDGMDDAWTSEQVARLKRRADRCTTHAHGCDCREYRLIQAELELETARQQITELQEQLIEERRTFPADGLWMVSALPGATGRSMVRISPVAELPDPVGLAAIARHQDAIAEAVQRCWQQYAEQGSQSPREVAAAIVAALHERGRTACLRW